MVALFAKIIFLTTYFGLGINAGNHFLESHYPNMTISINQSLAHGLEILLLYDASSPFFTVSEISRQLGYSQSKSYRLVRTLIKRGFLQENPGKAQYSLGLSVLHLGLLAQHRINIFEIARPFMEELSHLTRETVLLTGVNGTRGIVLDRVESEEPIRYSIFQPGATIPLHAGASSKILMAYLAEEEWDRIIRKEGLRRYTPNTITEAKRLKAHLKEIHRRGVAFSHQEVDRDVIAIAAPIVNKLGKLVAGLSIAGPAYRINKKAIRSYTRLVIQYSQRISNQLGNSQNHR